MANEISYIFEKKKIHFILHQNKVHLLLKTPNLKKMLPQQYIISQWYVFPFYEK